jgi:hypothetical protein
MPVWHIEKGTVVHIFRDAPFPVEQEDHLRGIALSLPWSIHQVGHQESTAGRIAPLNSSESHLHLSQHIPKELLPKRGSLSSVSHSIVKQSMIAMDFALYLLFHRDMPWE